MAKKPAEDESMFGGSEDAAEMETEDTEMAEDMDVAAGEELQAAIESKDGKRIADAVRAIVG